MASWLKCIIFFFFLSHYLCALWPTPSQAVRFPALHIQLGEKDGIWLGRPGSPPQNSKPTPLVYNGPVRITAGAWRAEKGTQHSLVCLFYKPTRCQWALCGLIHSWFKRCTVWQLLYGHSTLVSKNCSRINRLWPCNSFIKSKLTCLPL